MKRKNLIIICLSLLLCSFAPAAIVITGAVYPTDPLNWNEYENGHIGDTNVGSLVMDAGTDALVCQYLYVGEHSKGNGLLSMSGGSALQTVGLYVGMTENVTNKGKITLDGTGTTLSVVAAGAIPGSASIGRYGDAELYITNGAKLNAAAGITTGQYASADCVIEVSGSGSEMECSGNLLVVNVGTGSMEITDGGSVITHGYGSVAYGNGGNGSVLVSDSGSSWRIDGDLYVARYGRGALTIKNGGLVSVGGTLGMNMLGSLNNGYTRMSNDGQLALYGDGSADADSFYGLMNQAPDANNLVTYWNGSEWDDIANATENVDYTLEYVTSGDLSGYTILTVTALGPCEYTITGDFNNDCIVNFEDFAVIAENWMIDCMYPGIDAVCENL